MTDSNDALIAEVRGWANRSPLGLSTMRELDKGILYTRRLADALEATTANRDEFRTAWNNSEFDVVRIEDDLARAREAIEKTEDWVTAHYLDTHMGKTVLEMLATQKQSGAGDE